MEKSINSRGKVMEHETFGNPEIERYIHVICQNPHQYAKHLYQRILLCRSIQSCYTLSMTVVQMH